ncbi:MAG: hypothetical protein RMK98_09060, partial [Bacteroidia bacterium]|nr:hypothetical protein [Bacteroidia bacterium]
RLIQGAEGSSDASVGCQENPEAFCLPEKRKKEWVEGVYKALEESEKESSYLQAFYRTLEAVRAGFVAEHREEAQRVFRQLVTVPALPKLRCKDLKKAIEQLEEEFKVSEVDDRKAREVFLLKWHEKIVASFFVQVPFYLVDKQKGLLLRVCKDVFKGLPNRVKRRLEGVYVLEGYDYSFEKGLHPGAGASIQDLEEQIL